MSVQKYDSTNKILKLIAGGTLWADCPLGTINAFGGSTAPEGWLLCQGQAISRTDYSALFAVIGTAFGAGDGSTTFNVPDFREVVPVGAGTSTRSEIATHDAFDVGQFKDDQFQSHIHDVYPANSPTGGTMTYLSSYTGATGSGAYHSRTGTARDCNGRNGTTTRTKELGVNYIIKAKQVALPADFEAALKEFLNDKNLLTWG
jgi:microcystin-dependent protein